MFLTSVIDPQGNTTTLNYDASFRITSIVDPMGRSTTYTYGLTAYPLLITKITDPFGRTAQMTYDISGRLSTITDPVGITSTFTYSTTETTFVNSLPRPIRHLYLQRHDQPQRHAIRSTTYGARSRSP